MPRICHATLVVPLREQRDDWLQQCLCSALEQTVGTTVVVVTSEHTPASNLQLIAQLQGTHRELHCFERPEGDGFAGAINAGFQYAPTARVGLLLSDDWLAPNAVKTCMEFDSDMVVTGRRAFSGDGRSILWERIPNRAEFDQLTTLEQKASYLGHFFLFNRQLVLSAGGVDPNIGLTGADDYDLPWTLLERGASVHLVEDALYNYRDHDEIRLTLRDRETQVEDLRRVLSKHGLEKQEIERLVDVKQKWYGVPCYYAIDNPDWYISNGPVS
jgi:glycosyltransferase involved in cell wall biosynthesis